MSTEHKFPYRWTLADAVFTKDKGKVFSCFACGGGSTMGYKLAGFDVVGCNEIDPKMMSAYIANHKPKYSYLEDIRVLKDRDDLPPELYDLDILDGSPPCSSFSMAGNREKDWGKEKKFREGQAKQVLDTLFFDFIELAEKLKPKVVIAENVKGILQGGARVYYRKVLDEMDKAGYYSQAFLLDASKMGVPQKRERVFFIGLRKDLAKPFLYQKDLFTTLPKLDLRFSEKGIPFGDVFERGDYERPLIPSVIDLWDSILDSDIGLDIVSGRVNDKPNNFFNHKILRMDKVANTVLAHPDYCVLDTEKRYRSSIEMIRCGAFPTDYDFGELKPNYLIGMSVPPVMTAQIASRIWEQWLSKI